jgi:hypothetical protein
MYWPIIVCAPSHPMDSARPQNNCNTTSAQIHGATG